MKAHPDPERTKRLGESEEAGLVHLTAPGALGVTEIEPIGARVLRDDEKLLTPAATRRSASPMTSARSRLLSRPRKLGMMQKLHLLLQPSEIFT